MIDVDSNYRKMHLMQKMSIDLNVICIQLTHEIPHFLIVLLWQSKHPQIVSHVLYTVVDFSNTINGLAK